MIDSLTNKNTLQFSMILIICRLFILLWYFQKEPTYFVCLRGCQFCPGERLKAPVFAVVLLLHLALWKVLRVQGTYCNYRSSLYVLQIFKSIVIYDE